jgi:glyoxylase-like metal-dependent hydrolase (beta-lactamase superfamily II)
VRRTLRCAALLALASAATEATTPTSTASAAAASTTPTLIAPGVTVISGTFIEGQQPDGNTVVFAAPDGLIVMDTGRHLEHTQQILDFAQQAKRPITAIINSHWHLDHIGGNTRIRSAYPHARIYASGALEGAMQGFLADYRRDLEGALRQTPNDPQAQGWRDELAIIAATPQSVADERMDTSGTRVIAGRKLFVHLERHAVTAGDVWIFDPSTHVLAAGDLVTLPVPFLDTACPQGWKAALDNLSHTRFGTLVPGHGTPMQRTGFEAYRRAFGNLLTCSASRETSNSECVEGWIRDAGTLIADADQHRAHTMMDYYVVNSLRAKPERIEKLCGA